MTAETANTETPVDVITAEERRQAHSPEIGDQKQDEETQNRTAAALPKIIESPASPQQIPDPQEPPVRVRMRQKTPLTAKNGQKLNDENTAATNGDTPPTINGINASTAALLHRTMESLSELPPELEESNEEIRKLDSQLDHLNEYMDKIEERLKKHQEKMLETLKQQKEEREKRRRSFHERMQLNKQEDEEFQQQLSAILNRVDLSRKRQSVFDTIPGTEATNGSS